MSFVGFGEFGAHPGAGTGSGVGRYERLMFWVVLGVPLLLLLIDLAGGRTIRISGLMVAAPPLAAVFCGPGAVLVIGLATLGSVVVASWFNGLVGVANFPVVVATAVLICAASTMASAIRRRRERELTRVRRVAEVTQRVLLRPLPQRVGPLAVASCYLAAEEEAAIGGDLFAAASMGTTARVLVGDVQGKGLSAVATVSDLLGAFRRSARSRTPLPELAPSLESSLWEDLEERGSEEKEGAGAEGRGVKRRQLEGFVTAVVVDLPEGEHRIRALNCGHPSPLLLRDGRVTELAASRPAVPLGLGDLAAEPVRVDAFDFAPGDTLLLYTDGVIECRDAAGSFYPLAERVARWTDRDPERLLATIREDLRSFAHPRLEDDVALVAIRRDS